MNSIDAIREHFPKYNKAANSYAHRTSETGVTLCQKAREIERATLGYKSTKENRVKSVSFRCRLAPEEAQAVQLAMNRRGLTQQELLEHLLTEWAIKNAPDAATSRTKERI